jgi:hypothetical protein
VTAPWASQTAADFPLDRRRLRRRAVVAAADQPTQVCFSLSLDVGAIPTALHRARPFGIVLQSFVFLGPADTTNAAAHLARGNEDNWGLDAPILRRYVSLHHGDYLAVGLPNRAAAGVGLGNLSPSSPVS